MRTPDARSATTPMAAESSHREVVARVEGVRSLLRRLDLLKSFAWLFLILAPLALGLALADWWLRPGPVGRLINLAVLAAGLYFGIRRRVWRGLTHRRSAARVAMTIEEQWPEFDARLVSTVQLGPDATPRTGLLSQLFAETAALCGRLPLERVADWKPHRRLLAAGGAAALSGIILIAAALGSVSTWLKRILLPWSATAWPTRTQVLIENVPERVRRGDPVPVAGRLAGRLEREGEIVARDAAGGRWRRSRFEVDAEGRFTANWDAALNDLVLYCASGDGESERITVEAVTPPQVSAVRSRLIFRPYTGRGDVVLDSGDIEALEGTTAEIAFRSTRPVSRGEIRFRAGDPIPLTIDEATACSAQFEIRADDRYEVWLYDAYGFTSDTPAVWEIRALADSLPGVALRKPEGERRVTPVSLVEVEVEGHDDFGITGVELVWEVEGRDSRGRLRMPLRSASPENAEKDVVSRLAWDLAPLGLQPLDRVRFWIEMTDAGPYRSEGETGQSAPGLLNVMTPADLRRMVDDRIKGYYDQIQDIERQVERSRDQISQSAANLIGRQAQPGDIVEALRAEEWRNVENARRLLTLSAGLREAVNDLTSARLAEADEAGPLTRAADQLATLSNRNMETILENLRNVRRQMSGGD